MVKQPAPRRNFFALQAIYRCVAAILAACWGHGVMALSPAAPPLDLSAEQRQSAVDALRTALHEQSKWVKVHAAEYLLALSYDEDVESEFQNELKVHGDESEYRIGIWRVLARAARAPTERAALVDKIEAVARDDRAPDRLHAIESLAKLAAPLDAETLAAVRRWVEQASAAEAAFGRWLLALSAKDPADRAEQIEQLAEGLRADDPLARLRAAHALSQIEGLPPAASERLLAAGEIAQREAPSDALAMLARAQVLAAGWQSAEVAGDAQRVKKFRAALERLASGRPDVSRVYADSLARFGRAGDLPALASQFSHADVDVAASAAHAALRIERRRPHSLATVDWVIIAAYGLAMIGIGVFYAGRTKNSDDYLLGGRRMNPLTVGISLFATLMSTLTYLAVPGEMIVHGPMIMAGIAAFPLVAWIVGWSMIPFFMRMKATTAYEILETRFGYGGRVLGSVMFLLLRLFWMAVIIYKTTEIVLMPLFGLPASYTPWVCTVMGAVTVVYSSLGGLRAVVMTDVVQSAIMLGGAVLTLIVISARLGGVGAWWPQAWDPQWDPLRWGFDPTSTRTVATAVLAYFVWFICTSGSDQMAVQRYLATKDARAARQMFILSLAVNAACTIFLGIVGFALFAYYKRHPEGLADGASIATHADMLFTRFIVAGLPAGVSGFVVAGLLSAAMSSLSSGISSSCSTISVDYVDRWRRRPRSDRAELRQTMLVSWIAGFLIVALSMFVGLVEGNLLDVLHKVVNLLVAPLFVLFFMAMYVPRATASAAWLAVLASIAAAVAIAFGRVLGLGVLWIMPGSLAVGVAVGWLASLAFYRDASVRASQSASAASRPVR